MAIVLAHAMLNPGAFIVWIIVGLVAGVVTRNLLEGRGFGMVGDLVVGLIGALVGGFIMGMYEYGGAGFIGTIVVAFLLACILVGLLHSLAPGARS